MHPSPGDGRRGEVLLSSVSSDAHTWNLVFLELLLREWGYEVRNLGACVPDREILTALRKRPDRSLIISTVNGHGAADGQRLVRAIRQDPHIADIFAVIGGKLGVDGHDQQVVHGLIDAGFDAVFSDLNDPRLLLDRLVAGRGRPTLPAGVHS